MENYRWLAGLIAAHPNRTVFGRTRLQKEVKLLQSLGFYTDYSYTIHFYGPYSEGLYSDIGLLEAIGLVEETSDTTADSNPYYILKASPDAEIMQVEEFRDEISTLAAAPAVVLELAATYDAFRDAGADHNEALVRLRRKKGSKCDDGNLEKALALLGELGLETVG
ncbi:MAG: hypothetical protein RIC55_09455 [Pirellulaceae bacterium]